MMELGFVEKVEDSDEFAGDTFFVSKVGGKPAWLDHGALPAENSCKKCGKPLVLLLQIHASLTSCAEEAEENMEDPRTLLLFMCRDPQCHSLGDSRCFQVLRYESGGSKVSDTNPSASNSHTESPDVSIRSHDTPSKPQDSDTHGEDTGKQHAPFDLCVVCGGRGSKTCGGCRRVNYCSKYHQIHDWKLGHKKLCSNSTQSPPTLSYDPSAGVVLPEWEVVTEPEPDGHGKGEERSEEERMKDYEEYVKGKAGMGGAGGGAWSEEALKGMVGRRGGREEEDKVFRTFLKRIAVERQQVLRYQRGGEPLFISSDGIPKDSDILKCACGADRHFELQVLPQLLYYLKLDSAQSNPSIDWGTLVVYTCSSAHCQLGHGYHTEFLWKQEISN